jgi:hypothetical protein
MREAAGAMPGTWRWPSLRHPLWLWLGYFALYLLLDWVSYGYF